MVDEAKTENPLSNEEVRRLAALPEGDAVKALAAQAKHTKKLDKARVKARRMVEKVAKDLAAVCAELLRSDLPDKFLRVGRLVRLANQLQLEMSDRITDLRARGGVQPLGGGGLQLAAAGDYAPLGQDYDNGAGLVAMPYQGPGPVPDNVQLVRELIGQIGNVATKQAAPLPPREASPFDLEQALQARKTLLEQNQDTSAIDGFIAGLQQQLARQGAAFAKGEPDPAAVAQQAKLQEDLKKGMLGGVAGANLFGGLQALDHEWAHGNGAVPNGLLKAPVGEGGE